jgi:hypothetical protein
MRSPCVVTNHRAADENTKHVSHLQTGRPDSGREDSRPKSTLMQHAVTKYKCKSDWHRREQNRDPKPTSKGRSDQQACKRGYHCC